MRILHTSDWHLGQYFMGKTRNTEHEAFLGWLLELVDEKGIDALVVAGDVFDTGTPPSYARALYNEFIVSLQNTCCQQFIVLGGNHDSEATLNEARSILAFLNTRVTAGISKHPGDHVAVLENRDGSPGLILCAVPFIRPRDLIQSMGGQSAGEKQAEMGQAIQAFYSRVFAAARQQREELAGKGPRLPVMATGHLTVVGGRATESVRDIYIGSLAAFPSAGFPAADYIALGHLHQGQAVKNQPHIRYSGSPIPLSFDEGKREKQVLVAEFQNSGLKAVAPVPVPCFRRLVCLSGRLNEIEAGVRTLAAEVASAGDQPWGQRTVWLEAEVAGDDYLPDLQARVQAMLLDAAESPLSGRGPGRPGIELLRVRRRQTGRQPGLAPENKERLEELNPKEVFSRRLSLESLDDNQVKVMRALFDEILGQAEDRSKEDRR